MQMAVALPLSPCPAPRFWACDSRLDHILSKQRPGMAFCFPNFGNLHQNSVPRLHPYPRTLKLYELPASQRTASDQHRQRRNNQCFAVRQRQLLRSSYRIEYPCCLHALQRFFLHQEGTLVYQRSKAMLSDYGIDRCCPRPRMWRYQCFQEFHRRTLGNSDEPLARSRNNILWHPLWMRVLFREPRDTVRDEHLILEPHDGRRDLWAAQPRDRVCRFLVSEPCYFNALWCVTETWSVQKRKGSVGAAPHGCSLEPDQNRYTVQGLATPSLDPAAAAGAEAVEAQALSFDAIR
jgi:hypothetical protein